MNNLSPLLSGSFAGSHPNNIPDASNFMAIQPGPCCQYHLLCNCPLRQRPNQARSAFRPAPNHPKQTQFHQNLAGGFQLSNPIITPPGSTGVYPQPNPVDRFTNLSPQQHTTTPDSTLQPTCYYCRSSRTSANNFVANESLVEMAEIGDNVNDLNNLCFDHVVAEGLANVPIIDSGFSSTDFLSFLLCPPLTNSPAMILLPVSSHLSVQSRLTSLEIITADIVGPSKETAFNKGLFLLTICGVATGFTLDGRVVAHCDNSKGWIFLIKGTDQLIALALVDWPDRHLSAVDCSHPPPPTSAPAPVLKPTQVAAPLWQPVSTQENTVDTDFHPDKPLLRPGCLLLMSSSHKKYQWLYVFPFDGVATVALEREQMEAEGTDEDVVDLDLLVVGRHKTKLEQEYKVEVFFPLTCFYLTNLFASIT
ncbi:hypothetical protein MJO28_006942 [Puccinia striiformis f. sp. tritici]|uniref:Uncharacterized protein n=1 Tax=Puccinia striiformis f. sp. tritici TaxID=168172 RepID=A0ACC0ECH0_9BASI|nr:hypothetical protein MJO28_006942 [Puccinia striiformis f. sp. tritici]